MINPLKRRAILLKFASIVTSHCIHCNVCFSGKFAKVVIPPEELVELQVNLIRSHAAGVGPGLPPERTRAFMALRINVLAKGYSGMTSKSNQSMTMGVY